MNVNPLLSLNYKLYSLGWNSRLHRPLPPLQRLAFAIFYDFRLGYAEAHRWAAEPSAQRNTR
ncbi:MAG: hypothetical protein KME03_19545 [Aphanocapsa lilacina HA4352-LM1]|jgi:hypothetical protein|nr:hypothetical protein [Aphanocapsa lilacina HA4352-LM1]